MHPIGNELGTSPHGETPARSQTVGAKPLFVIYVLFYGGFVLLNALSPATMERTPFAGVNLAILYGLFLIALAFAIALIYDWLCESARVKLERRL